MARRTKRAVLAVRVSFEPARIASQCLVQAYERALPVQRRAVQAERRADGCRGATVATSPRVQQGSEHG